MNKSEEKEMMKKRPFTEISWYDWLIHYIPDPIKNGEWC